MKKYIILGLGLLFFCFSSPKPYKKAKKQNWMYVKDSLMFAAYELSNAEYNVYIKDLFSQNQLDAYQNAMPDTNVSIENKIFYINQPFIRLSFHHRSYSNFPLVGVNHQQAIAYCDWLTQKTNKDPKRVFKKVWIRLPTLSEWKYAAGAGNPNRNYPWKGNFVINSKGMFLANYKVIHEDNLVLDSNGNMVLRKCLIETKVKNNTGFDTILNNFVECESLRSPFATSRVKSYYPNEFGLYNMAGNVSELLADNKQYIGGDWSSIAYYLKLNTPTRTLEKPTSTVGFRYVIEVLEF